MSKPGPRFATDAGTAIADGQLVTRGGRVLTVVGRGETYHDAIAKAYEGVSRIAFDGMHYRRDIGLSALRFANPQNFRPLNS